MARAYSLDQFERVVAAVIDSGPSRRQLDSRLGVTVSTVIKCADRWPATGSAAPGNLGGFKPKTIAGGHAEWLFQRCRERAFTLRGLVKEMAMERALKVENHSVCGASTPRSSRTKKAAGQQ